MKKLLCVILAGITMFCFASCMEKGTYSKERDYTESIKQQSLDMVGLPDIVNYFEMAQLKEIYEMRDDPELILYWYTRNDMTGKWVFEGKCIGYGIPYGASITNPETRNYNSTAGSVTLPQAEPNGLYTNTVTSSATWILAIDEEGEIHPNYVESEVRVSPFKIDSNLCEEWSTGADY